MNYFLNHKHAPKPETLIEYLGISMEQAQIVRDIIKSESREFFLNDHLFPITSTLGEDSDPLVVVMSAINETVGGKEIKAIPFESRNGPGVFHHIAREQVEQDSIGFNSISNHFYLRSEAHVMSYGERHQSASNELSR
ncbi:hypothetical protein [Vibrio owensii]|uniref:hypothetical protein n=1 Tax=Vibrio owensii TaxID=696485 RepID=UPI003CC68BA8